MMNILLNIDQKNLILSVIILTLVLILLVLIYSEQFSSFKKKLDKGYFERLYQNDIKTRTIQVNDYRDTTYVVSNNRNVTISAAQIKNKTKPGKVDIEESFILEKRKKRLKRRTGRKVASAIFYLICLGFISLGIYQNFAGTLANINGASYATVITNSMSKTNEDNSSYLEGIEDLNQIEAYSVVKLYKVEDPSTIKKFGIYAYKNEENKLIIHRIVDVSYKDDGVYYTFKGDNNSFADKKLVNESQILYEYRGEANHALGLFVGFTKSSIGLISILYVMIGLAIIDSYENKKDKLYFDSLKLFVKHTNKDKYLALGKTKIVKL